MPARVIQSNTRDDNLSIISTTPPSESERSFVSAESENQSSKPSGGLHTSQLATSLAPSSTSPRRSLQKLVTTALPSPTRYGASLEQSNLSLETPHVVQNLSAPLSPPAGSYFAPQPGASGIEPRSPANKRPPASRSSHGIETSTGPPPALSTQRSYNAESPWRSSPPADLQSTPKPIPQHHETNDSIDSILRSTQSSKKDRTYSDPLKSASPVRPRSSAGGGQVNSMTAQQYGSGSFEDDQDPTLRVNGRKSADLREARDARDEQRSQEDLFLNLARTDSVVDEAAETMSRSERRRSRVGNFASRTSRPSSSGHLGYSSEQFHAQQGTPTHHYPSPQHSSFDRTPALRSLASLRDETSRDRPYAASAHPLDQRPRTHNSDSTTPRLQNGSSYGYSPEAQMGSGRRRSIYETSPGFAPQAYKQSKLSYESQHNKYGSSPFQEHSSEEAQQLQHVEGTESTVSTTAPSTIWDELDEMKSRIRKIELTGKLPSSSSAAMSNVFGERPQTASTTMTTISSSPKRRQRQSTSLEASTIRAPGISDLHPLLHSALAKSKTAITPNLYKALEATASDALTLAAMTGHAGSQEASNSQASVIGGGSSTIDRQLRRKADSMCRSLTELCLALSEKSDAPVSSTRTRPASRDAPHRTEGVVDDSRFLRAASDDPELRSSSRVMSRLEARRTSLLGSSASYSRRESPQEIATPTSTMTPTSSRLDKTSSVLWRRDNEDEDSNTSKRPLSRAATEAGQIRPSPQTRASREYTSQHPLPGYTQRSPTVQSSLPPRKSYFPTTTSSPMTPNVQPGNRRYMDWATPPSSADNSRLAEARQRRIASVGQRTSAVPSRIGVLNGRLRQAESEQ